MYRHQILPFGKWDKHVLHNENSGNRLVLVPAYGATILEIVFGGVSVIDGYHTPEELDFNRWYKNMVLFPFPNRLREGTYKWMDEDYLFPINDPQTGNALHGIGVDKPMKVNQLELKAEGASIGCQYRDEGTDPAYPFPYTFEVRFDINEKNHCSIGMSFRNDGERPIPVGLGWHPYFSLSEKVDDLQLQLPPCMMIGVDEHMVPTGRQYEYDDFLHPRQIGATVLDNCFRLASNSVEARVHLRGARGHLEYWQETGPGKWNYLQIFTPPHRASLALEPMTCNIDAFNNGEGLIVLAPGETAEARFGFRYRRG